MNPLIDQTLEPWLWFLLVWSGRWAVVAVFIGGWLWLAAPRRAHARYLLCATGLAAGLALPLLPSWELPIWPAKRTAPASIGNVAERSQSVEAAPWAEPPVFPEPVYSDTSAAVAAPHDPASTVALQEPPSANAEAPPPRRLPPLRTSLGLRRWLVLAISAIWAFGVAIGCARLAYGLAGIYVLRRDATMLEPAAEELLESCARRVGVNRPVRLAQHPLVSSPIAVGLVRPMVLVPDDWQALPLNARRGSLLHELQHLSSYDDWWSVVRAAMGAFFFYHPLVHWLLWRMGYESELICDDAALASGLPGRDYARLLLAFAQRPNRLLRRWRLSRAGVVSLGSRRSVKTRIMRMLGDEHPWTNFRLSLRLRLLLILTCFAIGTAVGNVTLRAAAEKPAEVATRIAAAKPHAEPNKAAAAAAAPAQKPAKRTLKKREPDERSLGGRIYETQPITISIKGQAKDDNGQPLGGSEIFLAAANGFGASGAEAVLARTTTDAAGQYTFNGVSLPVRMYPPKPEVAEGGFQVFGIAKGHGFTWHGVRSYRPRPRPAAESEPAMDRAYYEGEAIENDLVFGPVVNLTGRVMDDLGRPVADATVQVGVINDPRRHGPEAKMYHCNLLVPEDATADPDRNFTSVLSLPESRLSAKTDAEGRYRIDEIPRDASLVAAVFAHEIDRLTATIVTTDREVSGSVNVGQGVWNPVLTAPRTVTIRTLDADTKEPLGDVVVQAQGRHARFAGNAARSDAQGRAVLRLPPGHYRLVAEPAIDSHRLRTEQELDVAKAPIEQAAVLPVGRGAAVVLIATADDSTPVPGVGFRYETDVSRESVELQSQTVFIDHPATDQDGILRAVFAPGKRRIFVGTVPEGYEPAGEQEEPRDFVAGSTTTFRFELRKQPVPPIAEDAGEVVTHLREQWRRQNAFKFTGRVTYRIHRSGYYDYSVPRDEIRQAINSFAWTKGADIVALINDEFPGLDVRLAGPYRMLIDGVKHHQTLSRSRVYGAEQTDVEAFNGSEIVLYDSANNQATVANPRGFHRHIDGVQDLRSWPFYGLGETSDDAASRAEGRITIDNEADGYTTRLVIEESTGFVYHSLFYQKAGGSGRDVWQFGPVELPNGMIWPSLLVDLQYQRDELSLITIHTIDAIEPRPALAADAFTVSVPAGALVLYLDGSESNRGLTGASSPMQGMTTGPVSDVVRFAYSLSPKSRSLWPVVKFGEPAPALNAAAWLTQEGKSEPPDLQGKVVLIDFWGQGCGPCVAELPKLVELAKRYAATDLRIVGWHDSGGDVENVARFARTHALPYTLAIDRPAGESGWFGAAFKSFGVHAIPHAALIDRGGRLVTIGQLDEVIGRLDDVLAVSSVSPPKTKQPK